MKKLYWLLSFVIISFLFFQCQKENSFIGGPDTGSSVTPDPITTSLQGNVVDENDQPATGVAVTAGAGMAITDANGYFRFTNAMLDKNTTLVTAEKDGYFKGYRVLAATSGCNQVLIKLIKKDLAGTVPASAGGEASLSNGAKVNLPANGIVTASSNSDYSGDIKVYASYINPKSSDIGKTIPGSLVANDKNGKRVVLSSYGMLAVELSSTSGEKLQIKSGSVATLTIPIPSSSVASAPATIPLWYIDEATGIWQEEGSATKQGTNYVGEVKHFSFWNSDEAFSGVNLSFTLHTSDNEPIVNAFVRILVKTTDTSTASSVAYGYTDSLGQVKGLVPSNKELTLEVVSACDGTVIYSQNIVSVTADKDLGVIQITDATSSVLTLTGTLVNCSNAPITNGYAIISLNGVRHNAATDANGRFSTTYITCSSSVNILIAGVDADAQQQGEQKEMTAVLPLADVGTITACGSSIEEQYINYTIDGSDYSITSANGDSLSGYDLNTSETIIRGFSSGATRYLGFKSFTSGAPGIFRLHALSVSNNDTVQVSPSTITFTKFPDNINSFYEGNFDGTYIDSNVSHTISATFKIKQ